MKIRVEHVFGSMVNEMGGKAVRTIGLARAETMLGLKNLTYNLKHYVFWQKQDLADAHCLNDRITSSKTAKIDEFWPF